VRFLAGLWEQHTGRHLTPKELGQLRDLKQALGDFTRDVIAWMFDAVNWWRFCQQVRAESRLHSAPPYPHVGFLLKHHNRALRIMRWELRDSTAAADVSFCARLDQLRCRELKWLVLVYALGRPEWLTRINAASNLTDLQEVFIALVDGKTAASP
jgi:hypothetical protein